MVSLNSSRRRRKSILRLAKQWSRSSRQGARPNTMNLGVTAMVATFCWRQVVSYSLQVPLSTTPLVGLQNKDEDATYARIWKQEEVNVLLRMAEQLLTHFTSWTLREVGSLLPIWSSRSSDSAHAGRCQGSRFRRRFQTVQCFMMENLSCFWFCFDHYSDYSRIDCGSGRWLNPTFLSVEEPFTVYEANWVGQLINWTSRLLQ